MNQAIRAPQIHKGAKVRQTDDSALSDLAFGQLGQQLFFLEFFPLPRCCSL